MTKEESKILTVFFLLFVLFTSVWVGISVWGTYNRISVTILCAFVVLSAVHGATLVVYAGLFGPSFPRKSRSPSERLESHNPY